MPLNQTVHFGNPPISFFHHMGMISLPQSNLFQVLCSFTTLYHSKLHQVCKQPAVQTVFFQVMGQCGKATNFPKHCDYRHQILTLLHVLEHGSTYPGTLGIPPELQANNAAIWQKRCSTTQLWPPCGISLRSW